MAYFASSITRLTWALIMNDRWMYPVQNWEQINATKWYMADTPVQPKN